MKKALNLYREVPGLYGEALSLDGRAFSLDGKPLCLEESPQPFRIKHSTLKRTFGIAVNFAVEGRMDKEVTLALFRETGVIAGESHVCGGIDGLRIRLKDFNASARYRPWFVLCDLDRRECPPSLCADFFKEPKADGMQFCVVVRSSEAWLMADWQAFAEFLKVDAGLIPRLPEQLPNPKHVAVQLALRSRNKDLRKGVVISPSGNVILTHAYMEEMLDYVKNCWSPQRACARSPSLKRAFQRCRAFAKRGQWL